MVFWICVCKFMGSLPLYFAACTLAWLDCIHFRNYVLGFQISELVGPFPPQTLWFPFLTTNLPFFSAKVSHNFPLRLFHLAKTPLVSLSLVFILHLGFLISVFGWFNMSIPSHYFGFHAPLEGSPPLRPSHFYLLAIILQSCFQVQPFVFCQ
jgi:hypothetical protein